ncbi:MAG: cellulase family glycosylhydrolase, partial [Ktedonobacteraceae bacterium]
MGKRIQRGGDPWWGLAHRWLTRRTFLQASGLAAGLGSFWLAGCSPRAQLKDVTAPVSVHTMPAELVPAGLGVNIHPNSATDADLTALATVGFRVVRLDVSWDQVERQPGHYDFSNYEPIIEVLLTHNISPLCILAYNNALYEHTSAPAPDNVGPHTDEVRQAFARFAAAAASHFQGRGIYWEIWNEPDYIRFWYPTPLADDYMKLAKLASVAIRQADPQAMIIAPALTGIEPQAQMTWTFLERCLALGLADLADALSVHPYRLDAPESVSADYQRLRALLARWSQHN